MYTYMYSTWATQEKHRQAVLIKIGLQNLAASYMALCGTPNRLSSGDMWSDCQL